MERRQTEPEKGPCVRYFFLRAPEFLYDVLAIVRFQDLSVEQARRFRKG